MHKRLRATCALFLTFLIPTTFCVCNGNSNANTFTDDESSFETREESIEIEHVENAESSEEATIDPDIWDVSNVDTSYVDGSRKLIAFSFDDAPARYMENILTVFTSFNEQNPDCKATATFFLNGSYVQPQNYPTLITAITLGMELGNHTFSHPDLSTLSKEEIALEIQRNDALLQEIDGKSAHLFRAPFGRLNDDVKAVVSAPIIDWTIDTLDWTNVEADDIYNTVFSNKFSGGIVLMHDGYPHTVSALKRLLPDLKDAGYQVVSISALAKAHDCVLRNGNVYIRARKPDQRR
ncbi:MAG: polysaccharide deacetylase family protein [Clostridia bacterium]|nr:polysaccharide deacetylase family protein [Clostridia bacterium]